MTSSKLLLPVTLTVLYFCVAACASHGSKPTVELTKARALVAQADKSGTAQRFAPADLQRAHDELSDAEQLDKQEQYDEARAKAERAEVDANLALARGNSQQEQKSAADIAEANNTLRQQTAQASTPGSSR